MRKLSLLIMLLLPTFLVFSQNVTVSKDTLVPVPISQLRKAMYDLQQYDVCKEEVKVQDSVNAKQHIKILYLDSLNRNYVAKDSIQQSRFTDCAFASNLKDEKITILESDVKRYKGITMGTVVLAIFGIILF